MERQELQRKPTESQVEHIKRIVYGKLVDKTIDCDYSELAPYVYGKEYSSDVCRRMMYGTRFILDVIGNGTDNAASLSSDFERIVNIQKETQKLKDQRRELSKLIRSEAREDHILSVIKESALLVADSFPYDIYTFKARKNDGVTDNEAVLVLNDWHYGMTTDNVFNKYNTLICKQRVSELIQKVSARMDVHKCKTLHVMIIGDMIHGAICTSARVASEERVVEQLMEVSEIIATSLIEFSRHVDNVNVYITYGNHARVVQEKKSSDHRDNIERFIGWWLRWRLDRYDNICIRSESMNEFIVEDVCGHGVCACHGDLDAVKASPKLLSAMFHKKHGRDIEYIILGDKHHEERYGELGVTAGICGSLCGTDDYANEKRLYSPPSQLLLIVSRSEGVDAEYHLKLH